MPYLRGLRPNEPPKRTYGTSSTHGAAERDLQEIVHQIAVEEGRPTTAEKVARTIIERCDRLASYRHLATEGTAASPIGDGVRLLSHKRWVNLFRYVDDGVVILRIADGKQDYLSWWLGP